MSKTILPKDVSDVELALATNVDHLLPAWDDIPKPYRDRLLANEPWGVQVFNTSFYGGSGPRVRDLIARSGIDRNKAIRHLYTCMASFEPKHEHKTAGVGWLIEQWFHRPTK